MTEIFVRRACSSFKVPEGDPHLVAYCTKEEGHEGPHYSILKGETWKEGEE